MFNKKMITILVLLAVMATGAAFAGDAPYKIYGKLHLSVDMLSNGDNSQMYLVSNTSRFGVKGAQELNENFTAIWQFESKLDMAKKGDETLANRNTFVGLKGTWGTALFGIHDTPFKTLGRKTTFFFDELGDNRQVLMNSDQRLQQVAVYATPDFSGFTAALAYQFDQGNKLTYPDPDNYEASTAFSGNAIYNKDAFLFGAAYEMWAKGYADDPLLDTTDSRGAFRFAGKYTGEKFAIAALYQNISNVDFTKDVKASSFGGEGMFAFSPKYAAKVAYYMTDPNTDVDNDDYSLMSIGIDHTFSKTMVFYAQYATVMNGDAAMQGLGGGAHGSYVAPVAGDDGMAKNPTGFSVGMWKKF